jgi:hypothetical protein
MKLNLRSFLKITLCEKVISIKIIIIIKSPLAKEESRQPLANPVLLSALYVIPQCDCRSCYHMATDEMELPWIAPGYGCHACS